MESSLHAQAYAHIYFSTGRFELSYGGSIVKGCSLIIHSIRLAPTDFSKYKSLCFLLIKRVVRGILGDKLYDSFRKR